MPWQNRDRVIKPGRDPKQKVADASEVRRIVEGILAEVESRGDAAVREQLALLEQAVAQTGYLVGEQFTLADINLLPILFYVRQLPEAAAAFDDATHLGRYYATHAMRPSFVRTVPPEGPPRRASP